MTPIHPNRDPFLRINALTERAYRLIFGIGTPSAVALGIGRLLWLADERDRRIKAGKGGAR